MLSKSYLISVIQIDRDSSAPIYAQIYESLRQAIITQQLVPGLKLPSTRDLATLLDVSRNTVLNAFDQLIAEGYLETRERSGIYINHQLPEPLLTSQTADRKTRAVQQQQPVLSQRGRTFARTKVHQTRKGNRHNLFTNGIPALDLFPFDIWARLTSRYYRYAPLSIFDETGDPAGYYPLRQAVAEHLRTARAVSCEAEQVIITTGSQQAFYIAAAMLLDPGDKVWMEEPGCMGPRAAFISQGATLIPVPVDDSGLDVVQGILAAPDARVAYINPSRQYPLGETLSLTRRYQLLKWANEANAWIIEDDYDSEFRYSGRPLASLQGLDTSNRVIYIGTFSKVLFPGLRLGYIVVPASLSNAFTAARALIEKHPHVVNQMVLHEFMVEGHFNRHIRRMRTVYDERRQLCYDALKAELDGLLWLGPSDAGMHICGYLPDALSDLKLAKAAEHRDIEVLPLSEFYIGASHKNGLILGYTGIQPQYIRSGVQELARAIEDDRIR